MRNSNAKKEKEKLIKYSQAEHFNKLKCQVNFGFCANPKFTLQKNFNTAIRMPLSSCYAQPTNLAFHNLCQSTKLPIGSRQLLGLNLKFCLASSHINSNINQTMLKMARSIRTLYYLKQHNANHNSDYEKQIYVQNRQWHPPPAPLQVEEKLSTFEKLLKAKQEELQRKYRNKNLANLTPLQQKVFNQLRQNQNIIIKPTDKNLGPAVMDLNTYVSQVLKEHLLTDTYKKLSPTETKDSLENIRNILKDMITSNKDKLSTAEFIYFQRSFKERFRLPLFYGLPKVHKTPMTLRPVVSCVKSLMSVFSNWLDYRMKQLLPFVKSYIRNSFDVIQELKGLAIPDNALLFSADATSMYTNIDTDLGIQAIRDFIHLHQVSLPTDFPSELFLQILEIVMKNNIFSFENTTWLQLSGTAMGTPAACAYATISFGQYENTCILPHFNRHLLYYKRYIDDIFGVWIPPDSQQERKWQNFKTALNNWGNLQWIVNEPSKNTVFLDLNISINQSAIQTSTYQKSLNLYLYIPPRSAHPPSCLKGLISGELRRYWLQNSCEDFKTFAARFMERLVDRGHLIQDLAPLFLNAAATLTNNSQPNQPKENNSILYIHWTYHPHGLQRKDIRAAYNSTLKPLLDYDKMTVAISRPRNLRDELTKTKLAATPAFDIDTIIREHCSRDNT
jgi:hypothetical protein